MAQVELFKKKSEYVKDGENKVATNFYIKCNDTLVSVEVKYFPNKDTGIDPGYSARKAVLSAFADTLPEKEEKAAVKQDDTSVDKMEPISDKNLPF